MLVMLIFRRKPRLDLRARRFAPCELRDSGVTNGCTLRQIGIADGKRFMGELLHSHFDQIPATLTGISHDVTAGSASGGLYGARNS